MATGAQNNLNYFDASYDAGQNQIIVSNQVSYVDISEKFNSQFHITPEFLIDNGILPFSTFYQLEQGREYSFDINIISS